MEKICILLVYCICISKCTVRKTVKYSSTHSLTSLLDGLDCQRHAPAALPPGETRYTFYRRLGWIQVWSRLVKKISPPLGFDPRTVQSVASHYTDCPRKGIWLLYHVLRRYRVAPSGWNYRTFWDIVFPFVSYDKPTCSCSVSGPVVASWGLSAVI